MRGPACPVGWVAAVKHHVQGVKCRRSPPRPTGQSRRAPHNTITDYSCVCTGLQAQDKTRRKRQPAPRFTLTPAARLACNDANYGRGGRGNHIQPAAAAASRAAAPAHAQVEGALPALCCVAMNSPHTQADQPWWVQLSGALLDVPARTALQKHAQEAAVRLQRPRCLCTQFAGTADAAASAGGGVPPRAAATMGRANGLAARRPSEFLRKHAKEPVLPEGEQTHAPNP